MTVIVDEWANKLWPLLNVTKKTRYDYSRLYERYLKPVIGHRELDDNIRQELQLHLLTLPPQTSRHCLMVAKTTWREALNYGVCSSNPTVGIRTPKIQEKPRPFLTWEEVDARDWGRYNHVPGQLKSAVLKVKILAFEKQFPCAVRVSKKYFVSALGYTQNFSLEPVRLGLFLSCNYPNT